MTLWEIILIGVGLSMDAATDRADQRHDLIPNYPTQAVFDAAVFRLFSRAHAAFRLSGRRTVRSAHHPIRRCHRLFDPRHHRPQNVQRRLWSYRSLRSGSTLTVQLVLIQAVATSIDAFAVGISFSAVGTAIVPAALTIMTTTFIISALCVFLGAGVGRLLGRKANWLGGIILMILAFKALLH